MVSKGNVPVSRRKSYGYHYFGVSPICKCSSSSAEALKAVGAKYLEASKITNHSHQPPPGSYSLSHKLIPFINSLIYIYICHLNKVLHP